MARNESRVIVQSKISFSPKPIKDRNKTRVFFVNALPDKLDDRDVMTWLTAPPKAVTEHEAKRSL
jgi:hypothetical protein